MKPPKVQYQARQIIGVVSSLAEAGHGRPGWGADPGNPDLRRPVAANARRVPVLPVPRPLRPHPGPHVIAPDPRPFFSRLPCGTVDNQSVEKGDHHRPPPPHAAASSPILAPKSPLPATRRRVTDIVIVIVPPAARSSFVVERPVKTASTGRLHPLHPYHLPRLSLNPLRAPCTAIAFALGGGFPGGGSANLGQRCCY